MTKTIVIKYKDGSEKEETGNYEGMMLFAKMRDIAKDKKVLTIEVKNE